MHLLRVALRKAKQVASSRSSYGNPEWGSELLLSGFALTKLRLQIHPERHGKRGFPHGHHA
jgi:hypothetical protein